MKKNKKELEIIKRLESNPLFKLGAIMDFFRRKDNEAFHYIAYYIKRLEEKYTVDELLEIAKDIVKHVEKEAEK